MNTTTKQPLQQTLANATDAINNENNVVRMEEQLKQAAAINTSIEPASIMKRDITQEELNIIKTRKDFLQKQHDTTYKIAVNAIKSLNDLSASIIALETAESIIQGKVPKDLPVLTNYHLSIQELTSEVAKPIKRKLNRASRDVQKAN